uniref:Homeobox-containing protein 1 n=1 Tax=Oncorhynchus kisutch TaxID=8019 RepID=A0A8C7HT80_ONCKI
MVKCTQAHRDREPRMSHYTDEPRFTIEQIDLLQRLRRTGMTKQEILHALDTLDRLDREHGAKFGHRTSYGGEASSSVSNPNCTTSNNTAATTSSSNITVDDNNNNNSTSGSSEVNNTTLASSCTNSTVAQTQYLSPRGGLSPSPSNSYDTSPLPSAVRHSPVSLVTMAQNGGRDSLVATPNGKLSPPRYPVNSAAAARVFGFEATEEELEIDDKVEELMRRDGSIVKEEIKSFLGNRRISQAVVAQVTGISQSRISHWLLQHGSDLSEQKKRAFYHWYQLEKTSPGATLNMRPAPMAMEEMEWRQTTPHISTAPGLFRLRRGSRFTWRKECLAVMESYFNDNQYPDEAKREEISNACNAVIQKPGKKLSDLERVSSLKVYNWFANRRKEIKRRANIGNVGWVSLSLLLTWAGFLCRRWLRGLGFSVVVGYVGWASLSSLVTWAAFLSVVVGYVGCVSLCCRWLRGLGFSVVVGYVGWVSLSPLVTWAGRRWVCLYNEGFQQDINLFHCHFFY